ncbi:hypothetical protein DMX07_24720 [Pseudomonas soli]|uniref:Uncharacterized protein n=1 Tax=Pseudomonas soli TaxID=1306993 RepID=A0A2V4HKC9_9PSED|nr:hypothetical protein DMX07_24720 [Pseudomonas soli]
MNNWPHRRQDRSHRYSARRDICAVGVGAGLPAKGREAPPVSQSNTRGGLTGVSAWAKAQRAISSLRMNATPAWPRA